MSDVVHVLKEWSGDLGCLVLLLLLLKFGRRAFLGCSHVILLFEGLTALIYPKVYLTPSSVVRNFDSIHYYISRVIGVNYVVQVLTLGMIDRSGDRRAMTAMVKTFMLNMFLGLGPLGYLLFVNPSTMDVKLNPQIIRTAFSARLLAGIGCLYYIIKEPSDDRRKKTVRTDGQLYVQIDAIILLVFGVTLMVMPWGIIYLTLYMAGREMEYDFFHDYLARIVGAMYINFALMSHYAARTSNIRVKNIIMATHLMLYVGQLVLSLMLTPDWSLARLSWIQLILQTVPDLCLAANSFLAMTKNNIITTKKILK